MELIAILNRCHRFRGFVHQYAHFSADKKNIEVAVRPRKASVEARSSGISRMIRMLQLYHRYRANMALGDLAPLARCPDTN
ncbi:MAG: hypothetical protein ABSG65_02835 [Bryobacteraceae bacterium]|jgi:hypothetical protein